MKKTARNARKWLSSTLSLLALVLALASACTAGSHSSIPGVTLGEFSGGSQTPGNADGYMGMTATAYFMDPSFTCPASSGSTQSYGYRNSLNYFNDGSVQLADPCTGTTSSVNPTEIETLNSSIMGYKAGMYQVLATPPTPRITDETYLVAWCAATDVPKGTLLGFLGEKTSITKVTSALVYSKNQSGFDLGNPFSIQFSLAGSLATVTSSMLDATIDVTLGHIIMDQYPGEMQLNGSTHPVLCRLLPSGLGVNAKPTPSPTPAP